MISPARLTQLAGDLPARYTTALLHLAPVRVLTGAHLDQLLAEPDTTPETTARIRRRIMTRLTELGLVMILQRRVGGVRAGSTGHIYTLTPAGYRFLAIIQGQLCPPRSRPSATPSALFLSHTLAVSNIYVQLITTSRDHNDLWLVRFVIEPACWQATAGGGYLKPDAYCVLSTATHQDCWWLEIDQATEHLPRIARKCRDYLDFLTHGGLGPDQVPPRVLFTTPDTDRRNALQKMITTLSKHCDRMISVTTHSDAAQFLITELLTP